MKTIRYRWHVALFTPWLVGFVACNSTQQTLTDDGALRLENIEVVGLLQGRVIGKVWNEPVQEDCTFQTVKAASAGEVHWLDQQQGLFRYEHQQVDKLQDSFEFQLICIAGSSNVATAMVAITQMGLQGKALYEDVQTICQDQSCRQDFQTSRKQPIRRARVQLRDSIELNRVLVEVMTDQNGVFQFPKVQQSDVMVVVLSESLWPLIRVIDNFQTGLLDKRSYALISSSLDIRQIDFLELVAGTGYDADSGQYTGARSAAPFVVLDTIVQASHILLEQRPQLQFPLLQINWSIQNVAETGDKRLGQITTSHWDGEEIYLLGGASSDADEFDKDVLVHEWGHYLESTLSRSDSLGGPHSRGDKLDMRVAFSEGFGNALAAIIGYPDTVYSDCSGVGGRYCFFFDIEANGSDPQSRGWYSESSVHALLYDLFDPYRVDEPFDEVSLPIGTLLDVMMQAHRTTPVFTSIFSYIHGLQSNNLAAHDAIHALCAYEHIEPVLGPRGQGENNDGGDHFALPIYHSLSNGATLRIQMDMGQDHLAASRMTYNRLVANRYIVMEQLDGDFTLTVQCPQPVSLLLYGAGIEQYVPQRTCPVAGCSSVQLNNLRFSSSQTYLLNLMGESYIDQEFSCSVKLSRS